MTVNIPYVATRSQPPQLAKPSWNGAPPHQHLSCLLQLRHQRVHHQCSRPYLDHMAAALVLCATPPKPKDKDEVCFEHTGLCRLLIGLLGHQKRTPRQTTISPSEVYTTLMRISISDLHLLGLSDEYTLRHQKRTPRQTTVDRRKSILP
jgi:hypothetical protein